MIVSNDTRDVRVTRLSLRLGHCVRLCLLCCRMVLVRHAANVKILRYTSSPRHGPRFHDCSSSQQTWLTMLSACMGSGVCVRVFVLSCRLYARFLEDVKHDPWSASKWFM